MNSGLDQRSGPNANSVVKVRQLWERAQAEGDNGRPAVSAKLGRRALRLLRRECPDEAGLHALILVNLAYQESELGDPGAAMALLDQAESIDSSILPRIEASRGGLLTRSGRNAEAVEHFDRAIAGVQSVQTEAGLEVLAIASLNRGVLHMYAGRLREAQLDTNSAERAARLVGNDVIVFMAAHNLGYLKFLTGDLPGALNSMASATEVMPVDAIGVSAMDRSRVLAAAGLLGESREFIDQAITAFAANRATTDLADALAVRAEIDLLAGDAASARANSRRASKIALARGNRRAAMVTEVLELRVARLDRETTRSPSRTRRDAVRAGDLADRLMAVDLVDDATAARLLHAEALVEDGDIAAARSVVDGLPSRTGSAGLAIRLHTALVAARIEIAAGRQASGFTQIRRGLDDLANFQARFGSQDLQSAAAVHGRELTRLGLRTAVGTGSPAVILQWLERARAVTTRLPTVRPPADPVLAEDLGALRMADEQARAALLAGRRDPAADRKVNELRHRVRARSWTTAGSGRADRPPTLAAVRRALDEHRGNAGIAALFVADGLIQALVITRSRAATLVLGRRADFESQRHRVQGDLDLLADQRIPARLAGVAAGSLTDSLQRMSDAFAPVLKIIGDGPVLIAAVGPLATVPWLLLPSLHGRPVAVSSSVTRSLAGLAATTTTAAQQGVLVVAGPDVANGGKEASAIAALYPGAEVLTGDRATGRAVLDAIPAGGLVHIVAHGHHEVGNPLFSGVKLADGLLYGYDIAPNPVLPGQVVLSSCDVGQTEDRPGGEPLGLVVALVRSGVPTVITGTSRIADSVAEATMIGYHRLLLRGVVPAAALTAAVFETTMNTPLPAPFTCFGAGV